jgi:uncharacterized membrane protein YGL010W
MRPVESLFDRYGESHRDPTNKSIHWICVPLITWSVVGLLWAASPFAAGFAIAAAIAFYFWLSPALALGMLIVLGAMAYAAALVGPALWMVSIVVFILAWIGQFIGHQIEGKSPSFFEDVKFLMVGPAWLLGSVYRRFAIVY